MSVYQNVFQAKANTSMICITGHQGFGHLFWLSMNFLGTVWGAPTSRSGGFLFHCESFRLGLNWPVKGADTSVWVIMPKDCHCGSSCALLMHTIETIKSPNYTGGTFSLKLIGWLNGSLLRATFFLFFSQGLNLARHKLDSFLWFFCMAFWWP